MRQRAMPKSPLRVRWPLCARRGAGRGNRRRWRRWSAGGVSRWVCRILLVGFGGGNRWPTWPDRRLWRRSAEPGSVCLQPWRKGTALHESGAAQTDIPARSLFCRYRGKSRHRASVPPAASPTHRNRFIGSELRRQSCNRKSSVRLTIWAMQQRSVHVCHAAAEYPCASSRLLLGHVQQRCLVRYCPNR